MDVRLAFSSISELLDLPAEFAAPPALGFRLSAKS